MSQVRKCSVPLWLAELLFGIEFLAVLVTSNDEVLNLEVIAVCCIVTFLVLLWLRRHTMFDEDVIRSFSFPIVGVYEDDNDVFWLTLRQVNSNGTLDLNFDISFISDTFKEYLLKIDDDGSVVASIKVNITSNDVLFLGVNEG